MRAPATTMRRVNRQKLSVGIVLAVEKISEQLELERQHARRGREFWLRIGESYYNIKSDPELDDIGGIDAIKSILPRTPQFLNRCAIAWNGHVTRDASQPSLTILEAAERWVKHTNYGLKNEYEPYKMAETVEAYERRLKPRHPNRIPVAITAGRLFVKNYSVTFEKLGTGALGDCHSLITEIPDESIHFVFLDPPFGLDCAPGRRRKTEHEWDRPLNWSLLWPHIWRVLKPAGTVAICAMEPLTSSLIQSQLDHYLYNHYWLRKATNIFHARTRPLSVIEGIAVFSKAGPSERTYNPQMEKLEKTIDRLNSARRYRFLSALARNVADEPNRRMIRAQYPTDLIITERSPHDSPRLIHCQKPVDYALQIIRTYTNPGNVVLDFCSGSFTTGVACHLLKRYFVGIEKYPGHFELGTRRLRALMNSQAVATKAAVE